MFLILLPMRVGKSADKYIFLDQILTTTNCIGICVSINKIKSIKMDRIEHTEYGITIRKISRQGNKIYHLPKLNLCKQMLTLLKKIKKIDSQAYYNYAVEKAKDKIGNHIHVKLSLSDPKYLPSILNILQKYIGGKGWYVENGIYYDITKCNGIYGEIHMHPIYDGFGYNAYINKTSQSVHLF